jgi:hypothetical protein
LRPGGFEPHVVESPRGKGPDRTRRPRGPSPPIRQIIWLAFMAAVLMYAAVGYVMVKDAQTPIAEVPGWLFPALGVALAAAALFVPGLLAGSAPPAREGVVLISPAELVAWALDEAVALVGLVAVLLGRSFSSSLLYFLVAWVLLWIHRPRG